jgi:hypothetical protein
LPAGTSQQPADTVIPALQPFRIQPTPVVVSEDASNPFSLGFSGYLVWVFCPPPK